MALRCEYTDDSYKRCNFIATRILNENNLLYARLCDEHLDTAQKDYSGKSLGQAITSLNQRLQYWLIQKRGFEFEQERRKFSGLFDLDPEPRRDGSIGADASGTKNT